MSYVDLHCHLLPGIDDGAATPDAAIAHARRLDAEGVKQLSAMPSLPELRARLLGLFQAPAARLVRVLAAPATQVVRVLKAKQEKDGGAA